MPETTKPLNGKIAVITGGTRGFGLAVAAAYAEAGARLVIASRSENSVQEAVGKLREAGAECAGMAVDVGKKEEVESLAAFALNTCGRFDIWVNNAGLSAPYGPTVHVPAEAFERVCQTNILGNYYGSLIAMKHFLPRKTGKLINILGRGSDGPTPFQNAYASSKAWLRSFTIALAKEYADSGVGVYAFNPGMMDTAFLQQPQVVAGYEDRLKFFGKVIQMWSAPPEVPARRAVWLASSATDGRTGLLVNEMSPLKMLGGALREGFNSLTGRGGRKIDLHITPVPPGWSADRE